MNQVPEKDLLDFFKNILYIVREWKARNKK